MLDDRRLRKGEADLVGDQEGLHFVTSIVHMLAAALELVAAFGVAEAVAIAAGFEVDVAVVVAIVAVVGIGALEDLRRMDQDLSEYLVVKFEEAVAAAENMTGLFGKGRHPMRTKVEHLKDLH